MEVVTTAWTRYLLLEVCVYMCVYTSASASCLSVSLTVPLSVSSSFVCALQVLAL